MATGQFYWLMHISPSLYSVIFFFKTFSYHISLLFPQKSQLSFFLHLLLSTTFFWDIQVSGKAYGHPLCQHTSTAWILVRPQQTAVSSSTGFSRTGTNSLSQFPTLIFHSSSSTDLYHVHSRLKQESEGRPFSQLPTLPVLCMEDKRERGGSLMKLCL